MTTRGLRAAFADRLQAKNFSNHSNPLKNFNASFFLREALCSNIIWALDRVIYGALMLTRSRSSLFPQLPQLNPRPSPSLTDSAISLSGGVRLLSELLTIAPSKSCPLHCWDNF